MLEAGAKIGVIGTGVMGKGISLVLAKHGYRVLIFDIDKKKINKVLQDISVSLQKDLEKEIIQEKEKQEVLKNILIAQSLAEFSDCDLIIEAIVENKTQKEMLFKKLDSICDKKTILASNTSTILISNLAKSVKRKDKFIGIHFINPVKVMNLIEIIPGSKTSKETIQKSLDLAEKIGKTPVVAKDSSGFILNRVLFPMINEAAYCLQEKTANKEEIDKAMKLGANLPMGPLELADLIGIDTCLFILQELDKGLPKRKYQPCPIFKKMVKQGQLGRKVKSGFYQY